MSTHETIEKSIIKKFKKTIWSKFTKSCREYELINDNDKIMVCISGGKDSVLLAKCLEHIQKYGTKKFEIEYVVMNPGYSEKNYELILHNAKILNIPIKIYDSNIFNVVTKINEGSPCYLCARMRRGFLYAKAKELGCNKIALGHHYDDVIETILLNLLYSGEIKTMMPKLHSQNFENMELIRPLYLVREEAIIKWKNYNSLEFLDCACLFTEKNREENTSKRLEMKNLIKSFKAVDENIEKNIFRSVENINLDAIIAYKVNGNKHNFMDDY